METPILDWKDESDGWVVSGDHPEVRLKRVGRWDIEGRIGNVQRISDPLLPTLGKYPRAVISPLDVVVLYGDFSENSIFDKISISHEFRTAWFQMNDQAVYDRFNSSRSGGDAALLGGALHEHTMPLNLLVYRKMLGLKRGDYVKLSAELVDIYDGDEAKHTDTVLGDKNCEFLLIEDVEVLTK